MNTRPLRSIYQLKVTLKWSRPPIWRRLQIASTDNLEDLHIALQIVMGWTNSHLHEFASGRDRFGVPDEEFSSDVHDEIEYRMDQVLQKEKDRLNYTYDFADGWEHDVVLRRSFEAKGARESLQWLDGVGACPPEDCGGPSGFRNLCESLADVLGTRPAPCQCKPGSLFSPKAEERFATTPAAK